MSAIFTKTVMALCALGALLSQPGPVTAQKERGRGRPIPARQKAAWNAQALPALPNGLPAWIKLNPVLDARFYNFYHNLGVRHPIFDDLYVGDMCHAIVEEALATGATRDLETASYSRMVGMLRDTAATSERESARPPAERFARKLSTLGHRYRYIQVAEVEAHEVHHQILQVLTDPNLTPSEQDRQIEEIARQYFRLPYAITPLPMNMVWLDGQVYSGKFRRRYPKTNALLWSHHWLSNSVFDAVYRKAQIQQAAAYSLVEDRYQKTELNRLDRPVMPMMAQTSPAFAARFPELANLFDNLHMLHDVINDILVSEGLAAKQREQQLQRAVWLFTAEAHKAEKPGGYSARNPLHDHRFAAGLPGMGLMRGGTPDLMFQPGLGWMRMDRCHHCSLPLPQGKDAWRCSRITAQGWTMRVRCALCARDLAAQTRGRVILHLPTEDPDESVVLTSDERGVLTTNTNVVFLEQEAGHVGCGDWSRAFTSRAAFNAYVRAHPELRDAVPLTLAAWSKRTGKKPDTYVKPVGPVTNPYATPVSGRSREREAPARCACCARTAGE